MSHSFRQLPEDLIQVLMKFLTIEERSAWMGCERYLAAQPICTSFQSFCGKCEACEGNTQHLCPLNKQNFTNWPWFLKRTNQGLRALFLSNCSIQCSLEMKREEWAIDSLRSLQVLSLHAMQSDSINLIEVLASTCSNLKEIYLRDLIIDNEVIAKLFARNVNTLEVVSLVGCVSIKNEALLALTRSPGQLLKLDLNGCHNVTNDTIVQICANNPQLRQLNLRYCYKISDSAVKSMLTLLPRLTELNLRYCYRITDEAIAHLCCLLPQIQKLNLSQCNSITDASIFAIVGELKHLEELKLWGCKNLTKRSVIAIAEGLPSLQLLDIRSRDKFEPVIGGTTALKYIMETYRDTLKMWQQSSREGVFERVHANFESDFNQNSTTRRLLQNCY